MSAKLKRVVDNYVDYWKKMETMERGKGPFIHPDDRKHFSDHIDMWFREKDASQYNGENVIHKKMLHLDLLPSPYVGDILNAKIIILMGNPGVEKPKGGVGDPAEYIDHKNMELWNALNNTLYQDFNSEDMKAYPYTFLNPKFIDTAGGRYDHTMFKHCIEDMKKLHGDDGISVLAKNICKFQFYPYHSASKPEGIKYFGRAFLEKTPSYKFYRGFLEEYFAIVSRMEDKLIFVTRWSKHLDGTYKESGNVIMPRFPNLVKNHFSYDFHDIITEHIKRWS